MGKARGSPAKVVLRGVAVVGSLAVVLFAAAPRSHAESDVHAQGGLVTLLAAPLDLADTPSLHSLPHVSERIVSLVDDAPADGPPPGWSLVSLTLKGDDGVVRNGGPRHWQKNAESPPEATEVTDAREGTRGSCPAGMVEVEGQMKQSALLDALQLQTCTDWIDHKWPERCAAYDRDAWLSLSADLPTKTMRFCMDRFEYPNRKGENPIVMVTWYEAKNSCRAQGKRLCSEDEWTFACEGEEAQPYPTGYTRDTSECVMDEPWDMPAEGSLLPRQAPRAGREVARLWHAEASGGERSCKSPFGVYDMTGNIDEWTRSSQAGRPSILKGGYFGPVRTRCRPSTRAHGEGHVYYQQGFRCCANAPSG